MALSSLLAPALPSEPSGATLVVVGGLGLFLLGMGVMTDGLKSLAGPALGRWLTRSTRSPSTGAVTGMLTTAAVQSSSATTVAAVGFVGAGLLTFEQALGIIFGANVGTTITGWMVALFGFKVDLGAVAPVLVFAGSLARLLAKGRVAALGSTLAGFGLLFTGIDLLQEGMAGYGERLTPAAFPPDTWAGRAQLVLLGVLVTLVTQSSSAGVATALAAVHSGAVTFSQAAALVIGMDVGTTFTAILATLGASRQARRTGYSHVVYNVATAVGAFLLLDAYAMGLEAARPGVTGAEPELALVGFHTLFNGLGVVAILPFTRPYARFMRRLVPDGREAAAPLDPRLAREPEVALHVALQSARGLVRRALRLTAGDLRSRSTRERRAAAREGLVEDTARAREFVLLVESSRDRRALHAAHVELLDALDHVARLNERLEAPAPPRARTTATELERDLVRQGRAVATSLLAAASGLRDGGAGPQVASLRERWEELAEGAQDLRDRILADSASGALPGARSIRCADDARRQVRLARHAYRAVQHLEAATRLLEGSRPRANAELGLDRAGDR